MPTFHIKDKHTIGATIEAHHFVEQGSMVVFYDKDDAKTADRVFAIPVAELVSIHRAPDPK